MLQGRREIVSWRIDDLKEHPRQREMFPEHSPDRFQAFVDDLRENGQRDPIEIGPDGTIFDGHHRKKAAKVLDWDTVDVVVLPELAAAGEAAQLRYMHSRNASRRQMTELDMARAFRCMKSATGSSTDRDLRDEIATLLGCPKQGRTLERLVKVLDMPPPIQTAFSHGTLKKTVVYQLSTLPTEIQEKIAKRIEDGESPTAVAAKYVKSPKTKRNGTDDTPQDLYFVLMVFLNDHLDTLDQERDFIVGSAMNHERAAEILGRTGELCHYLRRKETEARHAAVSRMKSLVSERLGVSAQTEIGNMESDPK